MVTLFGQSEAKAKESLFLVLEVLCKEISNK